MRIVHPLDLESPAIFVCAQAGCETCLEALLHGHEGLVQAILRRQWRGDLAYAELLQEGRIALWQAIRHFDPYRGVAFSSYAWPAIERRLWRVVAVATRPAGAERAGGHRVARPQLADTLLRLPDRLREVIIAAYGLDGLPPRSLAALGRHYDVSRESVRLWCNEALLRLRLPAFSARLRALCNQNSRAAYARAQALNRAWLSRRRKRRRP